MYVSVYDNKGACKNRKKYFRVIKQFEYYSQGYYTKLIHVYKIYSLIFRQLLCTYSTPI